ncbi:pentatricopeptide repeat-containing protein At4g14820 [Lolium perenne]|uniref:pentatricopeptide repeat-containing protein At4g14820 n=1 Tax=Lolium perenne TaxID=4522 RepID=UPI0021EAE396|nr:pentatricopeptide repeat-containing protein At4g14820-like [Lolium perenne]
MEARAPPLESISGHRKQLHAHLLRRGYPFPPADCPEPDRAYLSVLRAAVAAPVLALTASVCLRRAGLPVPGRRAFPALLRAAARTRCADSVGSAHGLAVRVGVEDDGFVGTALVGAYAACRRVGDARRVFEGMWDRDIVAWGVMLDSYFQIQDYKEAFRLLNKMKRSRVVPDQVIIATFLSTCGHTRNLRSGKIIHTYILVSGIFIDARLSSALINMYATCAEMEMAKKLYNGMQRKDLVSSTAMVCGYAKNGKIEAARSIFNGMPDKDVVSWSAMISVYAESNQPSEALYMFKDMQECGVTPDEITILSVISACANIGSLDKARWIHSFVVNRGFCKILSICNALIDMFSKCGSLALALNMFNAMPRKNVITWTSMIAAFATHGDGRSALNLFGRMKSEGIEPNAVTFLCLLSACCHAGLVDEGRSLFKCMIQEYRIEPKHEHYGCMVDLMAKSKLLQEAVDLIESMHIIPNVAVWGSLLSACWMHDDLELGAFAAKKILELDPNHDGAYVILSKIHAKSDNWNSAREARGVMRVHGVSKETGCSWV